MAKGNRETKKPKKEKIKIIAAAPSQKGTAAGWQPNFGQARRNKETEVHRVRSHWQKLPVA